MSIMDGVVNSGGGGAGTQQPSGPNSQGGRGGPGVILIRY
jgi:hypothetical protein